MNTWFHVDKDGLARLLERRGKSWLGLELLQNTFDTDATEVDVVTERKSGSPNITLTVTDNSSTGFPDLRDAYTLFAPSQKADNPELRGRFNVGEKAALALALSASVRSTTGTVRFGEDGRSHSKESTDVGTVVSALLRFSESEVADLHDAVHSVIVPDSVTLRLNGDRVESSSPLFVTRGSLTTEVADSDGIMRRRQRQTEVHVHTASAHSVPMIYELGMPVCPSDIPYSIDVRQTVPLGIERATVPQSFRRALNTLTLEVAAGHLSQDQASQPWVEEVIDRVPAETVATVLHRRFGKGVVAADPSDPEATKRALDAGRTVIQPRTVKKSTWNAIRSAREESPDFVPPAGQVYPSGVPTDPDGIPPVAEDEWSHGMSVVASYASGLAAAAGLAGVGINFFKGVTGNWAGCAGGNTVSFNLQRLGHSWPDTVGQQELDELLIHEFAHLLDGGHDHYSSGFYDACCLIGARLRSCDLVLRSE